MGSLARLAGYHALMDVPAWLAKWKITSTWEAHIARGSKGGVDYGAPKGTSIIAPTAGTVDYRLLSDGSSVARVKRADGTATEFLHGIPYPNGKGSGSRAVKAGDIIATSDGTKGAWGANGSTGPHIHVHDVDKAGNRQRPFSTIPTSPAGGGTSPITPGDASMSYSLVKQADNATIWLVSLITGRRYGIPSPYYVTLLQRLKVNNANDPMYVAEIDYCQGMLAVVNPPAGLDVDALVAKIDAANDDETAAILAAIGKISVAAGATPAQIAAEVDKVLAGDFAAIPKAVLDQQSERLKA